MKNNEIIEIAKRLYARNMLAAADGNISVRDNNEIAITPSSKAKAFIISSDIARIDIDGRIISGKPSSEFLLHLEIYKRCTKAKAVIHAHPPHVIAWTIANPNLRELPNDALPEIILAMGSIPIADFAIPGTDQLAKSITPFLPGNRVIILARHGIVAWGETLAEAMNGVERTEHVAQILAIAKSLGGAQPMDRSYIKQLQKKRIEIGEKTI